MKTAHKNNPLQGAAFSALNAAMIAAASIFMKFLSDFFGPVEIVFFRNLIGLPLLIVGFTMLRQTLTLKTNRPWHHVIRSSIGTIGIICGAWAVSILSLAETTILFFTAPLYVVALSPLLLKEKIGVYRIAAVIIGFGGVVIMAGPTTNFPLLGLIAGLLWGFFAGLVDISLRWLGSTENSSTTTFYFLGLGLVATSLYLPFSNTITNFDWSWVLITLIIGVSLTNVIAQLAKAHSFRLAEASFIAPITYTMILWAVLFDYMIWNEIPTLEVLIGGTIIIASNLFIIYRENKTIC